MFWAFAGALACALMIPMEPNLLEEGIALHAAQRMNAGEHLYRDIAHFTGPFPFELLAVLFRIFGESIWAGRIALALMSGASCAATFALARGAKAGWFAHAAAACAAFSPILLFPLLSLYFYTTISLHLTVLATFATWRGTESKGWAVAAGVLIAFVALTKQNLGITLAPALLFGVGLGSAPSERLRNASALILGGVVVAVLTLATYGLRGDLGVLIHSLVIMPLSLGDSFTSGFPNLWPPGDLSPAIQPNVRYYIPHLYNILHGTSGKVPASLIALTQLLYALPFLALAATLARRFRGSLPAALWIHGIAVLVMIGNLFPRTDWGHLVFVIPCAATQLLMTLGGLRLPGRRFIAAGVLIALTLGSGMTVRALYGLAEEIDFGPRVPLFAVSEAVKNDGLPRAIALIRKHTEPGEPIFVPRSEPLVYFATDTRNPTPYSGVIPGFHEEQERAIIDGLEDVRFIVMSEIDQPLFLYYSDELPAVQHYFERHFQVREEYLGGKSSWILVYERGPDRGPTAIDLIDERASARAWTLDDDGSELESTRSLPKLGTIHNRRPLPVDLGSRGGGVDFEIRVPEAAHFQSDVGLARVREHSGMHRHPPATRLEVWVREAAQFERIASFPVLQRQGKGRRWTPVEVDLSSFAGREITLRLALASNRPLQKNRLTWWGSPRIVQAEK